MRVASTIPSLVLLSSCASIPDVSYNYYPSKMNGIATATQTVSCTPDGQTSVILNSATFTPTYAADIAAGSRSISIRSIEGKFGPFADSDANFQFYDDGRLKSINQSTTGQGETAIKSIVSLATTVAKAAAVADDNGKLKVSDICGVVQHFTAKDPAKAADPGPTSVALTYTANINSSSHEIFNPKDLAILKISDASGPLFKALQDAGAKLPTFYLGVHRYDVGNRTTNAPQTGPVSDTINVSLQQVDTAEIWIVADKQSAPDGKKAIWKGVVPIPTNESYNLPIPAAALFGQQKVTLTLAESGLLTQVEYSKTSGLAGASNAAGSIATALSPESAANQAADIKAQADIIAQQQRLHRCIVSPTTCT